MNLRCSLMFYATLSRFKRLFCGITGKCSDTCVTSLNPQKIPCSCIGDQFRATAHTTTQSSRTRVVPRRVCIGRLCRDLRYRFSGPFGLCGRMLSLAAILVALSPHPKIPFLADKA